jgi:prepilin-type N-terminal cleavage/methylation domain-containing protein
MIHRHAQRIRQAFTLVELLVVMGIIAILVSLLTVAVMRATVKGTELQARADIDGMSAAIAAFKQEFGVDYIPSRLLLREQGGYNISGASANLLEQDTVQFLQKVFGRRFNPNSPPSGFYDWNGDGVNFDPTINNKPPAVWLLEGHEVLVFLLGGIPTNQSTATVAACQGFSASPTDPTTQGGTRRGPFFEFKANRLLQKSQPVGGNSGFTSNYNFFLYVDPFTGNGQTPYAYFSSYKGANGYNRYAVNQTQNPVLTSQLLGSDCPSLGAAPWYSSTTASSFSGSIPLNGLTNYYNASGFQILCAGINQSFGAGGQWDAKLGLAPGDPGADDFTNFSANKLGTYMK